MSKVPRFGHLPQEQPNLSDQEERNERVLRQVEDENREFYEFNAQIARNVSLIQTGINEQVAHALTRGRPLPAGGGSPELNRIKEERVRNKLYRAVQGNENYETELGEERVRNKLYRAVQGNENYETELGEDSLHYQGSEGVEHMESPLPRRVGRQFVRVLRGVGSMIGTSPYIEAQINKRFGKNPSLEAQRLFVANRLTEPLTLIQSTNPTRYDEIMARIGLIAGAPIADATNRLSQLTLSELRNLRKWCRKANPPEPLSEERAFLDLLLVANSDQESGDEAGSAEVYNHQPLREFWNMLVTGSPECKALADQVKAALEDNSLYQLQTSQETTMFMAELRGRLYFLIATGEAPDLNAAAKQVTAEIDTFIKNETLPGAVDAAEAQAIEHLKAETNKIIQTIRQAIAEQSAFVQRRAELLVIEGSGTSSPDDKKKAENERLNVLEPQMAKNVKSLRASVDGLKDLLSLHPKLIDLTAPSYKTLETVLGPFDFNDHDAVDKLHEGFKTIKVAIDDIKPSVNPAKLTPFELTQRFMRKDYMRKHKLDETVYNEEANHYANVKAALRLEKVKSIDIKRTANQQGAEIMDRGVLGRGWNRVKNAVASGQDFIGLEPIDFANMTSDKLLQSVINSDETFSVFNGINKFTTPRRLKHTLNKSGRVVKRETLERFSLILEEAVSRFKKVKPSLEKGLDPDDWDLENLIEVLKKVKIEMWSREFLDKVNQTAEPGEREKVLVKMLRESRTQERQVEESLTKDVKNPDAMWRVLLVKNDLKRILNKKSLEGLNKLKTAGIEEKRARISKMETEMNALPEADPNRLRLTREVQNLRDEISTVDKQIAQSKDLYERVEAAKKYIDENNLSRREKREYLQSVGLTQVFNKMSTNFRLQKGWHYTKQGAKAFWSGTKTSWNWSRKKFLNAATARSLAKKSFSVGRMIATPVTAPLGFAWKYGTFPVRLIGRAMVRTTHMPKRLLGQFNRNFMRSYLKDRILEYEKRIDKLVARQKRLQAKISGMPYSWDKKRAARKINSIEEQIYELNGAANEYRKIAAEKQLNLGPIALYSEAANDNGEVISKAA